MKDHKNAHCIEQRAISQLGVAFRLHGRSPGTALDCIGLAAYALWGLDYIGSLPASYRLRGDHADWLRWELKRLNLTPLINGQSREVGDLLIFNVAARQLHLGILTSRGLVHAHAGLKKIVLAPSSSSWPVIGHWRKNGE